ncbi:hypothetical protein GCK32_000662 [Trichostrongylus colubriformis]|uniref:Uncharacterized protein n=1 Tax=Trichostrongylus colubriformis TaxID=6319 RepID=A0AAN8FII1_TRICO
MQLCFNLISSRSSHLPFSLLLSPLLQDTSNLRHYLFPHAVIDDSVSSDRLVCFRSSSTPPYKSFVTLDCSTLNE